MLRTHTFCSMNGQNVIDRIPLFKDLTPSQRSFFAAYFNSCEYAQGAIIFTQEAPADFYYLLVTGEVLVRYKPYDGPELTVAQVTSGGVFGWSAALGSSKYTTSAICNTDCQLLRMCGEDLHHLCRQDPKAGTSLLDLLASAVAERYNNTYTQVVALLEYSILNPTAERRQKNGDSS